MDRESYFSRVADVLRPETAGAETWLVAGVGSGGARFAEEATRFGVGRIILVDLPGECLEVHNLIRHPLGRSDLGRLKVEAMRERLLEINPFIEVEAHSLDVSEAGDKLRELVEASTQVHACTDNEESKHILNRLAVDAGVPLTFAGVYDGGCGGEAGRCLPGGACYACIAAALNRSLGGAGPENESFDYSNPDADEEFRSTAALNLDIASIVLIQARLALLTMQAKEDPAADPGCNLVVFGNRPVEGLFKHMLHSRLLFVPRDASCLVCGRDPAGETDLGEEFDRILKETARPPGEEVVR